MTHTPGPWAVKHERWIVATRGVHDGEIIVAPTYWMESPEAKAEAAANAVLIAASPDLLAALVNLSNGVLGTLPLMEEFCRREFGNTNYALLIQRANEARAIIAKAESRTDAPAHD